jgi:hypothetical protein
MDWTVSIHLNSLPEWQCALQFKAIAAKLKIPASSSVRCALVSPPSAALQSHSNA